MTSIFMIRESSIICKSGVKLEKLMVNNSNGEYKIGDETRDLLEIVL